MVEISRLLLSLSIITERNEYFSMDTRATVSHETIGYGSTRRAERRISVYHAG